MFSESIFIPAILVSMEIVDGGGGGCWRIKNFQEKRSLSVSVFVFFGEKFIKNKNLTVLA